MPDQQADEKILASNLMRWGLNELFVNRNWANSSGTPNYDALAECPSCYSLSTVRQMLNLLTEVELRLEPLHPGWLATILLIWVKSGGTHRLENRQEIPRPSYLQEQLGCSAAEAKEYLYAAEIIGLLRNVPFSKSKPVGQLKELYFGLICSECTGFNSPSSIGRRHLSPQLRRKVFFRDRHTCQECGASRGENDNLMLQVDHIVPVSKGGTDDFDNLVTLCSDCNLGKSDDNLYGAIEDSDTPYSS